MKPLIKDPRVLVIPRRLSDVKRIIAFMSNKGGVGKTVLATLSALILSDKGFKTGLLDLDFTNPSSHVVLGVDPKDLTIVEERGLIPPRINNVYFMTISAFTKDKAAPLRGSAVDNVFAEILSVTRWGVLDYLIIDTPPGFNDEHLDLIDFIERLEVVVLSTPSVLSVRSITKIIDVLLGSGVKLLGLIENMSDKPTLAKTCSELKIRYLGYIEFDPSLEHSLGNPPLLRETKVWRRLSSILEGV